MDLSAEQLLAIPVEEPERLFSKDGMAVEWKRLRSKWYDRTGSGAGNDEVLQHVKALYERACDKLVDDTWSPPGVLRIRTTDGRRFELKYKAKDAFDLGEVYIGDTHVSYAFTYENEDLFKVASNIIQGFSFPDAKMKAEAARYLPEVSAILRGEERLYLVLKKRPELIRLKDAIAHMGGIDSKHVAWIMSRLYNIGCYLQLGGKLAHCDISPETVFIDPADHKVCLLGGWWYAQRLGVKLFAIPERTAKLNIITDPKPVAKHEYTAELIRALGRDALGDINGSKLLMNKALKPAMVLWLRSPATSNALAEYKAWTDKVLKASFGERKFIVLDLKASDVYKELA